MLEQVLELLEQTRLERMEQLPRTSFHLQI